MKPNIKHYRNSCIYIYGVEYQKQKVSIGFESHRCHLGLMRQLRGISSAFILKITTFDRVIETRDNAARNLSRVVYDNGSEAHSIALHLLQHSGSSGSFRLVSQHATVSSARGFRVGMYSRLSVCEGSLSLKCAQCSTPYT